MVITFFSTVAVAILASPVVTLYGSTPPPTLTVTLFPSASSTLFLSKLKCETGGVSSFLLHEANAKEVRQHTATAVDLKNTFVLLGLFF